MVAKDIPESFESKRLSIRVPRDADVAALNAAICESIADLKRWMPWATQRPTLKETAEVVQRAQERFAKREDIHLLLFLKESGALVGSSGLHRIDWSVPKFEIGYWLSSAFVGKGFITEAVSCIARFAFEQLKANRVEIRCDERNERSWAVAERAGFELEGVLRNEVRDHDGSLRHTRVYSLIDVDMLQKQ